MPIAIYVGKSDKEKLRPLEYEIAGDGQRAVGTKRTVAIADEKWQLMASLLYPV